MNIKDKIELTIESNRVFYKPILILGMLAGSIYLNGFLSEYGVPFPLDIGVLTSTLLVIGALSLFLVTIATCYSLLASIIILDPFNTGYQRVINTSKSGLYVPKKINHLLFHLYILIIPFCLFYFLLMDNEYHLDEVNVYSLLSLHLTLTLMYSVFISRNAYITIKETSISSLKMLLHILFTQAISILSLCFFVLMLVPRVGNLDELTFFSVLFIFLLVNIFCLTPVFSLSKFNTLNNDNEEVSPELLIKNTQITPVWLAIVILVVISCLPQFSPYVGELPLRILNIGGGIEFIAVDGKKQCNSWPKFIISHKNSISCTTKKGKLLIQLGDRAYVIFSDKDKEKVVSINLSKSSIISDIPDNSIYFKLKAEQGNNIKKKSAKLK